MVQGKQIQQRITYRSAQISDARLASRLLFDTFPKMATFMIGLGDARRARKILFEIFGLDRHRFSYEFTVIACQDDAPIGLFIAYPGRSLTRLDWQLARVILKKYTFAEKLKLIRRSLPSVFIQEAAHDEYLLSNLAVKKGERSHGIGEQVLSYVEERAKQAGYRKLAIMVDIDNKDARRFYERFGYAIKAIYLEPNHRIKYLGHGYQRMLKVLET